VVEENRQRVAAEVERHAAAPPAALPMGRSTGTQGAHKPALGFLISREAVGLLWKGKL